MDNEYLIVGESNDSNNFVPSKNNIPFNEFILSKIAFNKDLISQIDGISGKCLTYGELLDKSKMLAASLLRLGALPNEVIAVSCENRLEYSVVMLASMFVGTVLAPINPTYTSDEIVHALTISKARIIFCSAFTFRNVNLSLSRLNGVCHLISFDDIANNPPVALVKYDTLIQGTAIEKFQQIRNGNVAVILTSSGTTGLPKGVMLSYANLKCFCNFTGINTLQATDIVLGLLPLYHGFGYGVLLTTFMMGAKIILLPKFEEKLFLSTIEKYKIIDVVTGSPLKRGQQGEILVRGEAVMLGYCNNTEATRQTIDAEGWLHTGDIGFVDQQGFFYIVDRLKELIKYNGYQVAPAELESVLLGMPGIRDAAVIGQPDLMAGELPVAYIVLQPNTSLTETSIINYVNGKVSPQKRLRGVKFIESIPRNPSGKILRRILREASKSKL